VAPTIPSFADLEQLPALLEQAQDFSGNRQAAAKKYFETAALDASRTIHETVLQLARAA
jgi:hypothetical protein